MIYMANAVKIIDSVKDTPCENINTNLQIIVEAIKKDADEFAKKEYHADDAK